MSGLLKRQAQAAVASLMAHRPPPSVPHWPPPALHPQPLLTTPRARFRPRSMRGEPIPAKYRVREAGWHESIDAEVAAMLAGGCCAVPHCGGVRLAALSGGCLLGRYGSGRRVEPQDRPHGHATQACCMHALARSLACRSMPARPSCSSASSFTPTPASVGKPYRELCELEGGIQEQLDSGTAADPEYWQVGGVTVFIFC